MGIHQLRYGALRFPLRAINHLFNCCASVLLLTLKSFQLYYNQSVFQPVNVLVDLLGSLTAIQALHNILVLK